MKLPFQSHFFDIPHLRKNPKRKVDLIREFYLTHPKKTTSYNRLLEIQLVWFLQVSCTEYGQRFQTYSNWLSPFLTLEPMFFITIFLFINFFIFFKFENLLLLINFLGDL